MLIASILPVNIQVSVVRCALLALMFDVAIPSSVQAQAINAKIITFLAPKAKSQIGGGDSTDAVVEALRASGAAFTDSDLGQDYPDDGDRLWGTPIKVISYANNKLADSDPTAQVMAGDVLQFKSTLFVYESVKGRKTTTQTVSADQHTSIVAKVNAKTFSPMMMYEQNAPQNTNAMLSNSVQTRVLALNPIDFGALRKGWVFFYRPKPRVTKAGKFQISVLNSTSSNQVPIIKSGIKTISRTPLSPTNTNSSYTALWANATSSASGLTLLLPNGAAMEVTDGVAYEIYKKSSGVAGLRTVSP